MATMNFLGLPEYGIGAAKVFGPNRALLKAKQDSVRRFKESGKPDTSFGAITPRPTPPSMPPSPYDAPPLLTPQELSGRDAESKEAAADMKAAAAMMMRAAETLISSASTGGNPTAMIQHAGLAPLV